MNPELSQALETINYVFIGVFTVEMGVKIIGLGPRLYVSDRFNVFDAVIVVLSYIELAFASSSSLSALRTFRLGRVFKMAKSWDSLRQVIETIIETLPNMGYLSILLLLFMFLPPLLLSSPSPPVPRPLCEGRSSRCFALVLLRSGLSWPFSSSCCSSCKPHLQFYTTSAPFLHHSYAIGVRIYTISTPLV